MKKVFIPCILLALAFALTACAAPATQQNAAVSSVPAANAPAAEPAAAVETAPEATVAPVPDAESSASVQTEPAAAPADTKKGIKADAKLTEEDALKAAFADAKLTEAEQKSAKVVKNRLDREDGILVYEIEFWLGNIEYEYDIDASSGSVRKAQKEQEGGGAPGTSESGIISETEAAAIVLKKVPGAEDKHLKIKLDREDGQRVYEGEIRYQGMEYEFELDAASGNILEWDEEKDD